jgi:hypothetical protein
MNTSYAIIMLNLIIYSNAYIIFENYNIYIKNESSINWSKICNITNEIEYIHNIFMQKFDVISINNIENECLNKKLYINNIISENSHIKELRLNKNYIRVSMLKFTDNNINTVYFNNISAINVYLDKNNITNIIIKDYVYINYLFLNNSNIKDMICLDNIFKIKDIKEIDLSDNLIHILSYKNIIVRSMNQIMLQSEHIYEKEHYILDIFIISLLSLIILIIILIFFSIMFYRYIQFIITKNLDRHYSEIDIRNDNIYDVPKYVRPL